MIYYKIYIKIDNKDIPKITEFIKQKESKKEDFNSSSSQLMQMFGG